MTKEQLDNERDETSGKELDQWIEEHPANLAFCHTLTDPENLRRELHAYDAANSDELRQITQAKIASAEPETNIKPIQRHRWFSTAFAAAAAILIAVFSIWYSKLNY